MPLSRNTLVAIILIGLFIVGWANAASPNLQSSEVCIPHPDHPIRSGLLDVVENEGEIATLPFQVGVPSGTDHVIASVGKITPNGTGGYIWECLTTDGPSQTQMVTISFYDKRNTLIRNSLFNLVVNNMPPQGVLVNRSSDPNLVNTDIQVEMTNPTDFSVEDSNAGFTYSFDCNDDDDLAFDLIDSHSPLYAGCRYEAAGNYTIVGRITDKDGGFSESRQQITIIQPTLIVDPDPVITTPDTYASCSNETTYDTVTIRGLRQGWTAVGRIIVEFVTGPRSRQLVPGGLHEFQHEGPGDFTLTISYPPVSDWPIFGQDNPLSEIHVDVQVGIYDENLNRIYSFGAGQDWDVYCLVSSRTDFVTPSPIPTLPTETPSSVCTQEWLDNEIQKRGLTPSDLIPAYDLNNDQQITCADYDAFMSLQPPNHNDIIPDPTQVPDVVTPQPIVENPPELPQECTEEWLRAELEKRGLDETELLEQYDVDKDGMITCNDYRLITQNG